MGCWQVLLGFAIGACVTQVFIRLLAKDSGGEGIQYFPPGSSLPPFPPPYVATNQGDPRILCWVPFRFPDNTNNENLSSPFVTRMKFTIGPHCDKLVFVTQNQGDVSSGDFLHHNYERIDKHDLWNQISRGWHIIGSKFALEYDWFVKLDADTFFVPGNLRHLVLSRNWDSDSLAYFGHTIFEQSRPANEPRSQFNLGAGYGISRGLLKHMLPYFASPGQAQSSSIERCPEWNRWGEDVKFADCLRHVFPTLLPNITRDAYNRETFLPFSPNYHLVTLDPTEVKWYWRGKQDPSKQSRLNCCSSRPILFHHMKSQREYMAVDYLITQLAVDPMEYL